MALTTVFCLSLLAVFHASAQSTCTTLQPVFELPLEATSTVYASTVTSTAPIDCGGCSLVVSTFRAIISTPVPTPTTTTTEPVTTSATFVCLPTISASTSSSTSSSSVSIAGPTASPLPPVTPKIQEFIDELSTAILYTELLANAGNEAKLCSVINPASLGEISGIAINGSAVQQEVCALAAIDFTTPSLSALVISENQAVVSYLATALFAVQVAGNYAGGPNLATLCSEIEATLIDNIFINYTPNVGTAVKDYVCSAASASASATSTAIASTTPPPYPQNTTTTTTPTCASPTGFANTVVPAPLPLATSNFQIAPAFTAAHTLFVIQNLNAAFPEATIASFCLDQCIAFRPNSTTGPCLSFDVNLGRPIPPTGNGGTMQWFCSGYDAYLTNDGSDYVPVDVQGSYMFGLGVNRDSE
ncbi:MAG: hypothetical protein ASARMPREDX12_000266 [Alectoria sarmentosa]|nr:MAG: hypothetical protein ASARMPREDX12_000266 [Alectoria sarmentosa]